MGKPVRGWALGASIGLATGAACAAAERTVTIETRPGVTVGFAVTEPEGPPAAVAVLYGGGAAILNLWRRPLARGRNFLIRSRTLLARQGLLVLSVDVPSDRRDGGMHGWRDTPEHRADAAAIVRWVRGQTAAPIWVMGNSTGSISAAYIAAAAPIDGVVLTSSFTEPSRFNRATVLDAALDRIRVPALIVHHRRDGCAHTPVYNVERIRSRLTASPRTEIMLFDGGDEPQSGPCDALAPHGFLGIEEQVVDAIAGWVKGQSRR